MPLTISGLKAALSDLCGGTLTAAGLDGSSTSSAWLGPIAAGLRSLGIAPASPLTAVDADLASVADDQVDQLLDVAELAALERALGNYAKVDEKLGLGEKRFSQLREALEQTIARKAAALRARYGVGLATVTAGTIDLAFESTSEDES